MSDTSVFERISTEQRITLLVDSVLDYAIYMLDTDGRVATWNAGARRFKGYTAEEIIGQHFSRFFTPEDRAAGAPERQLRIAVEEGRFEGEGRRLRKDGSELWVHAVIDPIWDRDGSLIGFAKITRDITDQRRAQQELEEARIALFQAQKLQAIGELTGGIAHDFNNLMTVIRGSAELLIRDDLPAERRRRYARAIVETAERASTLTSHLLAFGRRQALKPEVIDLRLWLDALGEVLSRTLGSGMRVVMDVAPDLWEVDVDAAELETALLNAAFNARDASPKGSTLRLSARNLPEEESVAITLKDRGTGMSPEVLERVFEPFFTTKPPGKGTGLGLSQIHGFAAQTGGRVDIRSTPGKGTELTLILPKAHRKAVEADVAAQQALPWRALDVLLVEDNEQVRHFAANLLEELNCTVTQAESAEDALAALVNRRFDLVFSDVLMAGMGGLALGRHLRETRPEQPVLLATGFSEEVSSGRAAGFHILQKPYGVDSLLSAMVEVLGEHSAKVQMRAVK